MSDAQGGSNWRRRVKDRLWHSASLSAVRAHRQERIIRTDDRVYAERAEAAGIPSELSDQALRARLLRRFTDRGFAPRRTRRPHVLYATPLDSWERHNIPPALGALAELTPFYLGEHGFDDRSPTWTVERDGLDVALLAFVRETHARRPIDLFVAYLSGYHITPRTVTAIGALGIPTCAYWWDDRLYFRGYMRGGRFTGAYDLATAYDLNLTNASRSVKKYLVEGGLAMFWPLGANPSHYHPMPELPFLHDVSFVGQRYGRRPAFIQRLRSLGVAVTTFGAGWERGPVAADAMVRLYAQSRVNLGISGVGDSMQEMVLKGRDFEVPMAGAVYVTNDQPDLSRVYEAGEEVIAYRTAVDCAAAIRALLADPERCERMRLAARARCLAQHTWEHRFRTLFGVMGLLPTSGAAQ